MFIRFSWLEFGILRRRHRIVADHRSTPYEWNARNPNRERNKISLSLFRLFYYSLLKIRISRNMILVRHVCLLRALCHSMRVCATRMNYLSPLHHAIWRLTKCSLRPSVIWLAEVPTAICSRWINVKKHTTFLYICTLDHRQWSFSRDVYD